MKCDMGYGSSHLGLLPRALLIAHALLLAWGAWRNSPTIDEYAYLTAGVSHWHLGTFDLCRVNPPLVRLVAAIPVVACHPAVDWTRYPTQEPSPTFRNDFKVASDFLKANGSRVFMYVVLARCACIPFSLLGAWLCFRWAGELFGRDAGLMALALWSFSPNMIAHGQLLTPDCAGASAGLAAAYCFWKWLKDSGRGNAALAGAALGFAQLARSTWILLFALWPVLCLIWNSAQLMRARWGAAWRRAAELSAILLVGLYILNLGYLFQGVLRPLGQYEFTSTSFAGFNAREQGVSGNRFRSGLLGKLPVPLPEDYVQGIDVQKGDFDQRIDSFLRGEWQRGGWWWYYLYALLIKVPLGTWTLIILSLIAACMKRAYRTAWRNELLLVAPSGLVLLLVSSQTGFSHHMRYVLGLFPFAFIWASRVARSFALEHKAIARAATVSVTVSICSSLSVYPHSLSYFNESVGGPLQGDWHLLDSNIDWGQDLFYLKRWLDAHPQANPIRVAYFPTIVDPELAGIRCEWPPIDGRSPRLFDQLATDIGPQPGWYAISLVESRAALNPYAYFREFEPVARAGYSILIYHITPEESERVRKKLGLARNRYRAPCRFSLTRGARRPVQIARIRSAIAAKAETTTSEVRTTN